MTAPDNKSVKRSFQTTMDDMRQELSLVEQIGSRISHASPLSVIGSFLGATLLRPRALIIGGIVASIALIAAHLVAHSHGYALSGSESLVGFAAGWVASHLYDGVIALQKRYTRR